MWLQIWLHPLYWRGLEKIKLCPALAEPDLWPPSQEEHRESEFPYILYFFCFLSYSIDPTCVVSHALVLPQWLKLWNGLRVLSKHYDKPSGSIDVQFSSNVYTLCASLNEQHWDSDAEATVEFSLYPFSGLRIDADTDIDLYLLLFER